MTSEEMFKELNEMQIQIMHEDSLLYEEEFLNESVQEQERYFSWMKRQFQDHINEIGFYKVSFI